MSTEKNASNMILIAAAAFAGTLHAASFDCAKAETRIEKLICSTPTLSEADEVMAAAYKKARAKTNLTAKEEEVLKQGQLDWLKYHVNQCPDAACVQEEYKR